MGAKLLGSVVGVATLALLQTQAARAQADAKAFEDCLAKIQQDAATYGMAPEQLLDVGSVRIVQFRRPDASITIICNRASAAPVTMVSRYKCEPGEKCSQKPPETVPGQR